MALTEPDLAAFAARIRPHFDPDLRDLAESFAHRYAQLFGPKVKELRPNTPIAEIASWSRNRDSFLEDLASSENELLMGLEDYLFVTLPAELKELRSTGTFQDLVRWHASHRRVA